MEVNMEEGRPDENAVVTEADDDARGDINIPDLEVIVIDDDGGGFDVVAGGDNCNDSTTTTDIVVPPPFKPGDHITYDCNVVGSFLMYQHHAIVLAVGQDSFLASSSTAKSDTLCDNSTNENDEWTMCITDFTCDDSSGGLSNNCGVGSVTSFSPSSSTFGCYSYFTTTKTATTVTESVLKSFASGRRNQEIDRRDDDGDDAPRNVEDDGNITNQHQQAQPQAQAQQPDSQLRILCVSTKGWKKVQYNNNNNNNNNNNLNDDDSIVRHRIGFLLRHPQLIPKYNLLQSNCECVAVWCKTGIWQTLQAKYWLERSRPITNIIGYRRSFRTGTAGDDDCGNLEDRSLTKAAAAATTTACPTTTTTTANAAGRAVATVGVLSFAGMAYVSTTTAAAAAAVAAAEITSHMLCPQMKWNEQTQLLNDRFLNENNTKRRRTRY